MKRSGFAVIALVTMFTLAGCTEAEVFPSPTASPSAPSVGSIEDPLPMGETIEGSGWEVTVNSVNLDATADVSAANQFNPKPDEDEKYILVNMTLERTGNSAAHPFAIQVGFVNSNGITIRESAAVVPERIDLLAEMQPEATFTGNVGFLIDTDSAAGGTLSITPGDREDRVYVATD